MARALRGPTKQHQLPVLAQATTMGEATISTTSTAPTPAGASTMPHTPQTCTPIIKAAATPTAAPTMPVAVGVLQWVVSASMGTVAVASPTHTTPATWLGRRTRQRVRCPVPQRRQTQLPRGGPVAAAAPAANLIMRIAVVSGVAWRCCLLAQRSGDTISAHAATMPAEGQCIFSLDASFRLGRAERKWQEWLHNFISRALFHEHNTLSLHPRCVASALAQICMLALTLVTGLTPAAMPTAPLPVLPALTTPASLCMKQLACRRRTAGCVVTL